MLHDTDPKVMPEGEVRWFERTNRAILDDRGRGTGHQSVARDITGRRPARLALAESEARLAAFTRNAPLGMYPKDLDGRCAVLNPEMEKVLGRPAADMLGRGPEARRGGADPLARGAAPEREAAGDGLAARGRGPRARQPAGHPRRPGASLLDEGAARGVLARRAGTIRAAAERCARIVQTFVAMARREPPERRAIDPNDVARAALEIASYGLRAAGAAARADLAPDLPPLVADNGAGVPAGIIRPRIFEPFFATKPPAAGRASGSPSAAASPRPTRAGWSWSTPPAAPPSASRCRRPARRRPRPPAEVPPRAGPAAAARLTALIVDDEP